MPTALEFLRRLVDTNSWTENRVGVNRVADLTVEGFSSLGFAVERVSSANPAWGEHLILDSGPGGHGSIAMISHLDTVFPPEEEERNQFHWSVEGDRIFGPGTHDIKGGTLMMWLVLDALQTLAPEVFRRTRWQLFWNSSEEMLSPDFGTLCRTRLDPKTQAALVFEAEGKGPGVRRLVVSRKGRGTWRIRARGRGAHAGVHPERGANAIVQLAASLQRVVSFGDPSRGLTFNVGKISGGSGLNRVPHEAVAEGEFRAFLPEVYADARQQLLNLAGAGEVFSPMDGFRCSVDVELLSETRPWPRNSHSLALLDQFVAAARELGETVEGESRGGLSDGNHLWDHVPTLDGLGPSGDNDHCSERSPDGSKLPEYVDLSSFVPKASLNVLAILRTLR